MSKVKIKNMYTPQSSKDIKRKFEFYYREKFFNLWMSKYEFVGLTYQQKHYLMKKLWAEGSVAVSSINLGDKNLEELMAGGVIDMKENDIIITPWAFANRYNIYDFPTHIRLINTRGVKFITAKELELDKEAVIIYAQKNHKSVFSSIEAKFYELVDIEMKMRVSRKAQAQPWMFVFDPEDFKQAKNMQEQLDADAPYLFVSLAQADRAKGLNSGANYITDKQEQDRQKVENDILTMLGVNNVGIGEKKEHLIVDEVNANNENIEQQNISFQSEIEDGFDRVNKVLGKSIKVVDMYELYEPEQEPEKEEEDTYVEEN